MSELEKKFYEYFDKNYKLGGHRYSKLLKEQIKDLAEIAEKDCLNKLKRTKKQLLPEKLREAYKLPLEKIEAVQKENTELKKQLGEGVVIAEGIAGDEKWCKEIRLNAPKLKGKKGKLIFIEEK